MRYRYLLPSSPFPPVLLPLPSSFKEKTGLPLVPYFSASKLAWCLDNIPGLRADAEAGLALAGTIDSFLIWRLTRDANSSSSSSSSDKKSSGGLHVTDVSNASRTMLLNIHTLKWDAELCAAFRVPLRMLPSVVPSSGAVGKGAQFSPLPGVPIAGILGDQQAALFGQACFSPGDAKNTYGTGCFLLLNAGFNVPNPPTDSGLLTTIAYQRAGHPVVYALEGSVAVAGAAVSWLRDALKIIESPQEMEALAASVPDAGGSVLVPAFNGLFAPHWRSDARGAWVGLSAGVGRAHLARATLEAVAHQSRELLTSMERALGADAPRGALRVDGGMTANALLMQLQADYTGRRCVRPVVVETTALGAAYAAGLATGFWKDEAQLRAQWREDRSWVPQAKPEDVIKSCRDWDRALARTLYWQGGGADQALTLLPKAQNDLARKQLISLVGAFCTGALIATLGWIGMSQHLRRK